MKLTKSEIDALACPPGRRDRLVFDDDIPGFGLRVTADNAKVFLLQYQLGGRAGRRTRLVLGRYPETKIATARQLAKDARARLRLGYDPASERKAAHAAAAAARHVAVFTLDALISQWARVGLKDRSISHRKEAPRALRKCFASLLPLSASELEAATVQEKIDALAGSGPVMARRTRDYATAAFTWAVRRSLVAANPFGGVVIEARERSRDRVLTDRELGEVWRAAQSLGHPFGPFLSLLILTLQRRGEVAGMRWAELAPDLSTWIIPASRTKNHKAHIVHLAEPARAILRAVPREKGQALVFPARPSRARKVGDPTTGAAGNPPRGERRPISGFSDAKDRLAKAIMLDRARASGSKGAPGDPLDWRVHDFRRTGVTALARLGYAPHVADRLLNHVQGAIRGVAAVYQRHDFLAEREAALTVWAGHVLTAAAAPLLSASPDGKRRRRRRVRDM
jgi:integrase